jgi:triosephosphate isomerase
MRAKIVAGNWKMNLNVVESQLLVGELMHKLSEINTQAKVIIAPSFVNLPIIDVATENAEITIAAQNVHHKEKGAYTGEVSADMLSALGVENVIIGHSERRAYCNDSNSILKEKVDKALEYNMNIIFCIGEQLEDRKNDKHFDIIKEQVESALFHLEKFAYNFITIAYEPVWAIGTGETASPEQAQEMHAYIRSLLATKYSVELADSISILYGGSVKPSNAEAIFAKADIDGGLIGGAALNADDFTAIIKAI